MNQTMQKVKESSVFSWYRSFTPAARAAILFAIPFTVVDAVHYYTAGTALAVSFPILILIYLLCGAFAARIASQEQQDPGSLPGTGRSAALRLWVTSTVINTVISLLLGFATLGVTMLSGIFYLCIFAPLHALGSALVGWLGGWLYKQHLLRTNSS